VARREQARHDRRFPRGSSEPVRDNVEVEVRNALYGRRMRSVTRSARGLEDVSRPARVRSGKSRAGLAERRGLRDTFDR
jgi:hypothetical protein